jgi:hypothetical protein
MGRDPQKGRIYRNIDRIFTTHRYPSFQPGIITHTAIIRHRPTITPILHLCSNLETSPIHHRSNYIFLPTVDNCGVSSSPTPSTSSPANIMSTLALLGPLPLSPFRLPPSFSTINTPLCPSRLPRTNKHISQLQKSSIFILGRGIPSFSPRMVSQGIHSVVSGTNSP